MSEERIHLFEYLSNRVFIRPDLTQEERNEANENFNKEFHNPASIFELFEVHRLSTCPTAKHLAIIVLPRLILEFLNDFNQEQYQAFQHILIKSFQNETNVRIRYNICDIFQAVILVSEKSQTPIDNNWIIEFASSLFQDPQILAFSFHLWSYVIRIDHSAPFISMLPQLFEIAISNLQNPDIDVRIEAVKFLTNLLELSGANSDSSSLFQDQNFLESIFEHLSQTVNNAFLTQSDNEIKAYLPLLDLPCGFAFDPFKLSLGLLGMQLVANEELPVSYRLNAFYLAEYDLECTCQVINSLPTDDNSLSDSILKLIKLSYAVLNEDRSCNDFEFPTAFISACILTYPILFNDLWSYCHQIMESSQGNLAANQLCLYLLKVCVRPALDLIQECLDEFVQFAFSIADIEDESIITYMFKLLKRLVTSFKELYTPFIESTINFIMKYADHPQALSTLEIIFSRSAYLPINICSILSHLASNACTESHYQESLVRTIAAALTAPTRDGSTLEKVFQIVMPVLNSLIGKENFYGSIARAFGNIAHLCPKSFSSHFSTISNFLMNAFSTSNFDYIGETIGAFKNIVKTHSGFLEPLVQTITTNLFGVLQNLPRDEFEEIRNQFQRYIFLTLAQFIHYYPVLMIPIFPNFLSLLQPYVTSNGSDLCQVSYQCLGIAASGLVLQPELNFSSYIIPSIKHLCEFQEKSDINAYNYAYRCMVEAIGDRNLNPEDAQQEVHKLTDGISAPSIYFLDTPISDSISPAIIPDLFQLLFSIIHSSPQQADNLTQTLQGIFGSYLQWKVDRMTSYCIYLFSLQAHFVRDLPNDLLNITLQLTISGLEQTKNPVFKNTLFKAYCYSLRYTFSLKGYTEHNARLAECAHEDIASTSALFIGDGPAVWLAYYSLLLNIPLSIDEINLILQCLGHEDDIDVMPFIALVISKFGENEEVRKLPKFAKMLGFIMSLNHWNISTIDTTINPYIMDYNPSIIIASYFVEVPEDVMAEALSFNQTLLLRAQNTAAKILGKTTP